MNYVTIVVLITQTGKVQVMAQGSILFPDTLPLCILE